MLSGNWPSTAASSAGSAVPKTTAKATAKAGSGQSCVRQKSVHCAPRPVIRNKPLAAQVLYSLFLPSTRVAPLPVLDLAELELLSVLSSSYRCPSKQFHIPSSEGGTGVMRADV